MRRILADRSARAAVLGARAALALAAFALGLAEDGAAKPVTVADLLASSPTTDWRVPDPEDTLYMDLARGRIVIELASRVAPQHAANIRALARAHYFDGLAIVRVQDNYVVQWDDPEHRRPVPAAVRRSVEFTAAAAAEARFEPLPDRDVYAPQVGFLDGFPAARDPRSHLVWLAHCYGMVGAGRDDPPASDGTEMYAVIGNAPRQLDRNVALVGRVIKGMELLSSLPRGSGEMGFYAGSESAVPIRSMRIAADVPDAQRTPIEVLRTDSATFRALLEQRRERHEPWFKYSPDRIDLCNVPLPARAIPSAGR
ncbi:MAG TPA: peptidylprolyl isomerase [Steroidobacteraceae bacterium]|nr:peptidylprolyl isomerase [Steroidobacteraceae bacterium]